MDKCCDTCKNLAEDEDFCSGFSEDCGKYVPKNIDDIIAEVEKLRKDNEQQEKEIKRLKAKMYDLNARNNKLIRRIVFDGKELKDEKEKLKRENKKLKESFKGSCYEHLEIVTELKEALKKSSPFNTAGKGCWGCGTFFNSEHSEICEYKNLIGNT